MRKKEFLNMITTIHTQIRHRGAFDPHTDMHVSHITQPKLEHRNMLWLVLSVPNTATVPQFQSWTYARCLSWTITRFRQPIKCGSLLLTLHCPSFRKRVITMCSNLVRMHVALLLANLLGRLAYLREPTHESCHVRHYMAYI